MEIRRLRASELDRAFDLDADAFHQAEDKRELWRLCVDPARIVGAFDGERLLAMTHVLEFGQYFGGRSVPMGGLASVAVVPEARGRGLASRVIRACLEEMRARGEVISSLFPATTGLYRRFGWELAGDFRIRQVRARRLRDVPRPERGALRRLAEGDWPGVEACYAAFAAGVSGCLDRPPHWWRRKRWQWRERDAFVFEGDDGALEGYLVYRKMGGAHAHLGGDFDLTVEELVASSRDASLALWRLLGDWASQVDAVAFRGGADDPSLLLLPEQVFEPLAEIRWMTRVVDAPGAVAARGFPQGLSVEVPLRLHDAECAANQGDFVLTVQKGRGALAPASRGAGPTLDAGAFASLYTGWSGTASLARSGRLRGGSGEQRAALDAAFAGPTPWLPEEF